MPDPETTYPEFIFPAAFGNDWDVYRTADTIVAKFVSTPLTFEDVDYADGGWLCYDQTNGDTFFVEAATFNATYVPVSNAKKDSPTGNEPVPESPAPPL